MGLFGIFHPFPTLGLPILFRTFLFYLVQVVDKALHFLFTSFFVRLDVVYHVIDAFLGLFVFLLVCHLEVLFNCLGCFDSEIVLDHVHILGHIRDLFILVKEGQFEHTLTIDILLVDTFGSEDPLNHGMISCNITNFGIDDRDIELEDEIFGHSRHELAKFDLVLTVVDFLPHFAIHPLDFDTFDNIFGNIVDLQRDLARNQRYNPTKGITKSLIERRKLLNKIKSPILHLTKLGHKILIMIRPKPKRMDSKNPELFIDGVFEALFEGGFGTFVLAVREKEDGGYFVYVFAVSDCF